MRDDADRARGADYLRQAACMRSRAEGAFDPQIAADYYALAAQWARLAEQAEGDSTSISALLSEVAAVGVRPLP